MPFEVAISGIKVATSYSMKLCQHPVWYGWRFSQLLNCLTLPIILRFISINLILSFYAESAVDMGHFNTRREILRIWGKRFARSYSTLKSYQLCGCRSLKYISNYSFLASKSFLYWSLTWSSFWRFSHCVIVSQSKGWLAKFQPIWHVLWE